MALSFDLRALKRVKILRGFPALIRVIGPKRRNERGSGLESLVIKIKKIKKSYYLLIRFLN